MTNEDRIKRISLDEITAHSNLVELTTKRLQLTQADLITKVKSKDAKAIRHARLLISDQCRRVAQHARNAQALMKQGTSEDDLSLRQALVNMRLAGFESVILAGILFPSEEVEEIELAS